MRTRRSRRLAAFALVSGTLVTTSTLVGCGSEEPNPLGLPSLDAVAATAPAAPRSATVTPSGDRAGSAGGAGAGADADGIGASAELGTLAGSARRQRAVVQAAVEYMDVRVRIANTWSVDRAALAVVAAGPAARAARSRAAVMREGERRVVGTYVVNASRVRVSGDRAVVTGCMADRTSEVDPAGQVMVGPPGGRLVSLGLRRTDGDWRVTTVPRAVPPFCTPPGDAP